MWHFEKDDISQKIEFAKELVMGEILRMIKGGSFSKCGLLRKMAFLKIKAFGGCFILAS